jgi:hypothetical protein
VLRQDKDKKIKAVCVVHNETTTGVTSDIGEVHRRPQKLRSARPALAGALACCPGSTC